MSWGYRGIRNLVPHHSGFWFDRSLTEELSTGFNRPERVEGSVLRLRLNWTPIHHILILTLGS
jgi:hypothetical protein